MIIEEFKQCLPKQIVTYLNEQKVSSLSKAAVLVEEYLLTHKSTSSSKSTFTMANSQEQGTSKSSRVSNAATATAGCVTVASSG